MKEAVQSAGTAKSPFQGYCQIMNYIFFSTKKKKQGHFSF